MLAPPVPSLGWAHFRQLAGPKLRLRARAPVETRALSYSGWLLERLVRRRRRRRCDLAALLVRSSPSTFLSICIRVQFETHTQTEKLVLAPRTRRDSNASASACDLV